MSFQADDKARSRKLSNAAEQVVGRGTSHLLDTVTYDAADKIHHVTFQFRAYFPAISADDLPAHFTVRVNDGFAEPCVHTLRDYYVLGSAHVSCTEPITKLEFSVSAKADKHFTLPASSCIHYGAQPNESTPSAAAIPAPPAIAVSSRFSGMAASPDCAAIHPDLPDEMWVYKAGNIQYYSIATESEIRPATTIASVFPEVTGTVQFAYRGGLKGQNSQGQDVYWQYWIYNSNMDYYRYEFVNGAFSYLGTGNHSWLQYTASGYDWQLNFKTDGGGNKVDALGNTGNWQPYGAGEALYPTLPNTAPVTAVVNDKVNNRVLAFIGDSMYSLSGSPSNTVLDSWTYDAAVVQPVTQYFFMGFGSHWSMGHDTSAGHVTKFTERIALINATLPANEHWALASPSTVDKTNDILNFFDNQITALQNHANADSNGQFSSELLTSSSWTGGNFSAGVSPPIYQGHPILVNLTRDGSGDWSFGDGVSLALSSDRWENTTQASDNAVMWGNGGSWGGDTKSTKAGKFKIEPATQLRLYAIFERTI